VSPVAKGPMELRAKGRLIRLVSDASRQASRSSPTALGMASPRWAHWHAHPHPTSGYLVLVHLGELALDLALKAGWISLRNGGQGVLELLSLLPHAKFFHPTSGFSG